MENLSVLIPDGESTLAKFVVHGLALDPDVTIHILSKDPKAHIRRSKFVSSFSTYNDDVIGIVKPAPGSNPTKEMAELIRYHHYDHARSKELVGEIINHAKKVKANVLLPVDEHIVKIISSYRSEFSNAGLKFLIPDHDTFVNTIDKWELSKILKANNVPHPATMVFQSGMANEVIDTFPFPAIIKPTDQGNALGIQAFKTAADMHASFRDTKLRHTYVVQPLIDGYDIDCSVLCKDGEVLAYTIQRGIVSQANKFQAAVGIQFLFDKEVIDVVQRMMKLLNWQGVAHIDLRYDNVAKRIVVIEVNARYWGSLLGSLNAGVNFPVLAVRAIAGETIKASKYENKRYFMGKAPTKKILSTLFKGKDEKVRLRDTSLFYSMRDPGPVLSEMIGKIKSKFF